MNDKDKEEYDKWLKDNFSKLIDQGNKGGLAKMNDDLTQCWQAACEYKQKEIDSIDCYIERDEKIKKLQAENAKLVDALRDIEDYGEYPSHKETPKIWKITNQVLKELELM